MSLTTTRCSVSMSQVRTNKQTGSLKGTFRAGDDHPSLSGQRFSHYNKRRSGTWAECWLSTDQFNDRLNKNNARSTDKDECARARRLAAKAKYREANRDKLRSDGRKYQSDNKEAYASNAARRRALVKNTSSKSCASTLKNYYIASRRISLCTGISWEVDHIIPLSLGGYHSPSNLQVVPSRWNRIKNNHNQDKIKTL